MPDQPTRPQDHFTLDAVAPFLRRFQPPDGDFDTGRDWQLSWGVYTMGAIRGPGGPAGTLKIARKDLANETAALTIDYRKAAPGGFRQQVTAELRCRTDRLCTPLNWTYAAKIVDRAGTPIEVTSLKKSATVTDGVVEIADGRHRRRIELPKQYTVNWSLFEAVGRLPREQFDPLRFAMLDHFDQLKPDQVLSFRGTHNVLLGTRTVPLHSYGQIGQGIVPWVYWVDRSGRLLFAVSGLEAYLLQSPTRT